MQIKRLYRFLYLIFHLELSFQCGLISSKSVFHAAVQSGTICVERFFLRLKERDSLHSTRSSPVTLHRPPHCPLPRSLPIICRIQKFELASGPRYEFEPQNLISLSAPSFFDFRISPLNRHWNPLMPIGQTTFYRSRFELFLSLRYHSIHRKIATCFYEFWRSISCSIAHRSIRPDFNGDSDK